MSGTSPRLSRKDLYVLHGRLKQAWNGLSVLNQHSHNLAYSKTPDVAGLRRYASATFKVLGLIFEIMDDVPSNMQRQGSLESSEENAFDVLEELENEGAVGSAKELQAMLRDDVVEVMRELESKLAIVMSNIERYDMKIAQGSIQSISEVLSSAGIAHIVVAATIRVPKLSEWHASHSKIFPQKKGSKRTTNRYHWATSHESYIEIDFDMNIEKWIVSAHGLETTNILRDQPSLANNVRLRKDRSGIYVFDTGRATAFETAEQAHKALVSCFRSDSANDAKLPADKADAKIAKQAKPSKPQQEFKGLLNKDFKIPAPKTKHGRPKGKATSLWN